MIAAENKWNRQNNTKSSTLCIQTSNEAFSPQVQMNDPIQNNNNNKYDKTKRDYDGFGSPTHP